MLNQHDVFDILSKYGVTFYVGVPDSYLNGFCNYALSFREHRNVIAANEGNAVGIAVGHYLATREVPLVYMQNSGLGNAVNPLASLVDVYDIPMLLLIGWRGQGGSEPNHPQHRLQGEMTPSILDLMHIPYRILNDSSEEFEDAVHSAIDHCVSKRHPFALLVPRGVMAAQHKSNNSDTAYPMSRERAIELVLDYMPGDTIYVATTGRATRELFYLRERRGETKECDFLNVGSMGHASSIALGIALEKPGQPVVVLDGDSAAIMHMGAMTMVSKVSASNLLHVVLNNGAHESVGGQPSAGHLVDFTVVARACGYQTVGHPVADEDGLVAAIGELRGHSGAGFIDCRIHKGLSNKLPPIVFDHREAADAFIDNLADEVDCL